MEEESNEMVEEIGILRKLENFKMRNMGKVKESQ